MTSSEWWGHTQLFDALKFFVICTVLVSLLGGLSDWLNYRLGQRLYRFPSRRSYYYSFVMILAVYTFSFWLAYLILQYT